MLEYHTYIVRNPDILGGKSIIKGTRITVELIIRKLANGYTVESLLNAYPLLNKVEINSALSYAADLIGNEKTIEMV